MPAVTTKFTQDDKLDLEMFGHNLEAQLSAGVNGIILGGTLGEASTLTNVEKETLIRESLKITSNRVPIIINIAEQSTRQAIEIANRAEKLGVNGLMMLPPMRYKATDDETVKYLSAVAENTRLPIMIYNNPVDYAINVSLEMMEELITYDNIQAIKESTRDVSNVTRIRSKFGDRLAIFSGVDTLALESLVMGADGWVAGLVCAFPRETVAIYRLVKAGRLQEAIEIYRWFLPLLELDISPQLVQNIKMAEAAVGMGTEIVRAPRMVLKGEERIRVMNIIDHGIATRPLLPEYMTLEEEVNFVGFVTNE